MWLEEISDGFLTTDDTWLLQNGAKLFGNLDMNGYRIKNLPVPTSPTEPVRLQDFSALTANAVGANYVGDSAPIFQFQGMRWFDPSVPTTYTWYEDGDSGQWVEETAQGVDGKLRQDLATTNSSVMIAGLSAEALASQFVNLKQFNATGGGDDSIPVFNWLTYLAANPTKIGIAEGGVYQVNNISLNAPNGLTIMGNATFRATGDPRLNMISLANVQGLVSMDGITIDGNNIVARPFEIKNIGTVGVGDVYIGVNSKFINAKNVAPRVDNAGAFRIQGAFNSVVFEGLVDGVDNTLTSDGVAVGAWFDWSGVDYIKHMVVTSNARIKNVKNSNATVSDADGLQGMTAGGSDSVLIVQSGAYFENCKGRAIKSQTATNQIDGPVIVRTLYDGAVEIDAQYGGGYCKNAMIYHDGCRVENVISSTTRVGLPSDFTMRDNRLFIKNAPAAKTGSMCFFWGVDNTNGITQDGLLCEGNKVIGGAVDYMVTVYAANVIDTNRAVIKDNHATAITNAFLAMRLVYDNPAQLTVLFEGNSCKVGCTGADIVAGGRLTVESDRANHKIQPLPVYPTTIVGGVLNIYAGNLQLVANEGSAGADDVTTISGGGYATGDLVVFKMAYSTQAPTFKNGTGNIFLSGSDFTLNSVKDRLVLSFDAETNQWHEVSRANNG
jgi:hypothetical protein